tara:strand:+ start:613 stop:762 length:150 start_codon:yes stop_codon:yes gene_type:complete
LLTTPAPKTRDTNGKTMEINFPIAKIQSHSTQKALNQCTNFPYKIKEFN